MYYVKDKYRNRTWNRYVSKWNWVVPFPRHRDELLCVSSATSRLISHESIRNRLTDVKRIMKQLISFDNEKEYIFDDLNNFQTENGWIFFSFRSIKSISKIKTYWITSKDNFIFLFISKKSFSCLSSIFNYSFFLPTIPIVHLLLKDKSFSRFSSYSSRSKKKKKKKNFDYISCITLFFRSRPTSLITPLNATY